MDRLFSLVAVHCLEMLVGAKWQACVAAEQVKLDSRRKNSLVKFLKHFKAQHPGVVPNMVLAASAMLNSTVGLRAPPHATEEQRRNLSVWCAHVITKHIQLLNNMQPSLVSDPKLRGVTVGLLYQMRHGVVVHGLVVLPRCAVLAQTLPMENYLESVFGVKSKCITETENMVKDVLRSANQDRMRQYGVDCVDRRVQRQR